MIYIKGALIKGHRFWRPLDYFHSVQWGSLVLLAWQSAVPAVFVSNFSSNQKKKNPLSEYGCLTLPWVEVPVFRELLLEIHYMFALSCSCKIIKVISACNELITCKNALNENFNADWIFMIILYKAWKQKLTHWNCWVALNYSAMTS